MTYLFESKDRNCQLGDKVHFVNFTFATSDESLAEFVRRNCKAQPQHYWEITPELLKEQMKGAGEEPAPVVDVPKRVVGKPPKVQVRVGMKVNEEV